MLADRLAADSGAQDKTALVRALCVHQASPPGASVLCLVTHGESKRRLVRLGVPVTSVVCYHDVMEGLVAHACLVGAVFFIGFVVVFVVVLLFLV